MTLSAYEKKRAETIAANAAQIEALGLNDFNLIQKKKQDSSKARVKSEAKDKCHLERRLPSQRLASLAPVNYSELNLGVAYAEEHVVTTDRDRRVTKIPFRYADEQYASISKKKIARVKHEEKPSIDDNISAQDAVAAGKLNAELGNYHLASQYFTRAILKFEPSEAKFVHLYRAFAASRTLVQANLGLAFQDIKVRRFSHQLCVYHH
jgi:hypothetical protein